MEAVVETTEDGKSRTHIGVTVCKGPETHRLVLTSPYHAAGRVVEIPRTRIESVTTVETASQTPDPDEHTDR